MRIEAFLLCWNEIDIMPFVLKHYQKFCDRITIMDNYSTDGSDKLAESMGCEVIKFGTQFFDDDENMKCKNSCWKGTYADWVIVADFDEVLMERFELLKGMGESLSIPNFRCDPRREITVFKTIGWQIMSDEFPKHDLLEVTNGYRFDNYSKNIVFNPKRIQEINYNPGAHRCDPVGDVVWSDESLYVLHYKHIGGVQRTIDRYKILNKRMSKENKRKGYGIHYARTPGSLRQEWAERMAISKPLI